jgi:hypothetical protein
VRAVLDGSKAQWRYTNLPAPPVPGAHRESSVCPTDQHKTTSAGLRSPPQFGPQFFACNVPSLPPCRAGLPSRLVEVASRPLISCAPQLCGRSCCAAVVAAAQEYSLGPGLVPNSGSPNWVFWHCSALCCIVIFLFVFGKNYLNFN